MFVVLAVSHLDKSPEFDAAGKTDESEGVSEHEVGTVRTSTLMEYNAVQDAMQCAAPTRRCVC